MLGAPLDTLANTFGGNCWVLSLTECDRKQKRQKTKHMFQLQDCCNIYSKQMSQVASCHNSCFATGTQLQDSQLISSIGFFDTSAAGSSALSSTVSWEVEFFIRLSVVNDEFYLMFCNWEVEFVSWQVEFVICERLMVNLSWIGSKSLVSVICPSCLLSF